MSKADEARDLLASLVFGRKEHKKDLKQLLQSEGQAAIGEFQIRSAFNEDAGEGDLCITISRWGSEVAATVVEPNDTPESILNRLISQVDFEMKFHRRNEAA